MAEHDQVGWRSMAATRRSRPRRVGGRRPARLTSTAPSPGRDRGMVTAEAAVVLPTLVLATVLLLWFVGVVAHQASLVQAAREAARAAARGDTVEQVSSVALRQVPGAEVSVIRKGEEITVRVSDSQPQGPRLVRPLQRRMSASTTTMREDGW